MRTPDRLNAGCVVLSYWGNRNRKAYRRKAFPALDQTSPLIPLLHIPTPAKTKNSIRGRSIMGDNKLPARQWTLRPPGLIHFNHRMPVGNVA